MDLSMYISNDYYIVVVLLYALGVGVKKHKKIPNWCIPIILSVSGVAICCGMSYAIKETIDISTVMQGILCGLTAVGTNQIIKQTVQNVSFNTSDDSDAQG